MAAPSAAEEIGGSAEANIGPQAPGNEMPPPAPLSAEKQVEKKSLLMQAAAARKGKPEESESEKLLKEEQELLRNITRQKALKGVKELAKVDVCPSLQSWLLPCILPSLHTEGNGYAVPLAVRKSVGAESNRPWAL